jgi:hypothetical protein|uniref:Uncharacterized protein n=1 Tax=Haptolina ericina TaxID=156174 RepID=A0A7S3AJ66_9EUKA|mmetsp:Transcript_20120/g.44905  ORF Transcript_20120/g.44905 Transcript_20120/m.44905 type:complete len:171 (+) Transcript_20120:185-697(+)
MLQSDVPKRSAYGQLLEDGFAGGAFNAADALHEYSYEKVLANITAYVGDPRVGWVRGFYNESLTTGLVREHGMQPALYVEIDCDLYSSSRSALTWLFDHGLIVPGTVLGYDDFRIGGDYGELRAHREAVKKYQVDLAPLVNGSEFCCFVVKACSTCSPQPAPIMSTAPAG